MVIAIAFVVFTLLACLKKSMNREIARTNPSTNATPAQPAADQAAASRRRRRPRRTPSQVSTKSLPPYMKEPGDHELVIYRGPLEMEDRPPNGMPPLSELDEHLDPSMTQFSISLNRVVSRDTLPDSSTTHLVRNISRDTMNQQSVETRSLESSLQSHTSSAGLLVSHTRTLSSDNPDARGEAPPYSEAVGGDVSALSLPQPPVPPSLEDANSQLARGAPGDRRSRFSFLFHPFTSQSRPTPGPSADGLASQPSHTRSGSAYSLPSSENASTTRPTTPNAPRSNLLGIRGVRTRASSAGSSAALSSPSMISLNSISAPLPHTLTRAEFRIPRGGLTPEQIKIITARDAPERFGRPYGPAAVAFAGSRVLLSADPGVPPPGFDEAVGSSAPVSGSSSIHSTGEDADSSEPGGGGDAAPAVIGEERVHDHAETDISSVPLEVATSPCTPKASLSRQPSLSTGEQQSTPLHVDTRTSMIQLSPGTADAEEPTTPPTARPTQIGLAVQA
ncbi:hypothetical protein ID866_7907 [Astraeus odoratus]|nr:hypothetical protein ID866_7907 [Astraeus odoratus]